MKPVRLSYVVVSERGTDWARHAELARERFESVVMLLQWSAESNLEFAQRVREKLHELGAISGATLVCGPSSCRDAIAARRTVVDTCLESLAGIAGRELSLVCPTTSHGKLPHWVNAAVAGMEQRDPALELYIDCEPRVEAA